MRLISIVTPCFNEQDNVIELYERIAKMRSAWPQYHFEHIFIDNASTDATVERVRDLITRDPAVRLIINARNFGHIRSPYHALLQAAGDAVVCMASDLQDPPELIAEFIGHWERGARVVAGIKKTSAERGFSWALRSMYYRFARKVADVDLLEHFTGFGLYDRRVVDVLRKLNDPYPYFRGIIAEIGFEVTRVPYSQPARTHGVTKNNFYTLFDLAILGITSHSKLPIRLATMAGFSLALRSLLISIVYLVLKVLYWDSFQLGTAPLLIGIFFFASVQLFFIGLIGEYVAAIHTRVLNRPLVTELERVNFEQPRSGDVSSSGGT